MSPHLEYFFLIRTLHLLNIWPSFLFFFIIWKWWQRLALFIFLSLGELRPLDRTDAL